MTRAAIDGGALLKMLYSSLLAGIGASVIFSLTVFGAIRSTDMRRSGRSGTAVAYAALAGAGLLLTAAVVVYGLILVAHKT